MLYAHSLDDAPEEDWETLDEHLQAVAAKARSNGAAFGFQDWAELAGLLHDLGKSSPAFQKRLRGGERVNHSTAGALEACKRWPRAGRLLAYAIAGHHGGLPDSGRLDERLKEAIPPYDPGFVTLPESAPPLPALRKVTRGGFTHSFFVRMLFSCLVDADFVETERWYDGEKTARRGRDIPLSTLAERLERHLAELTAGAKASPVNDARAAVQRACREAAALPPGLFSLTVPTGGGKTLASLLFALNHAHRHGQRRIIYAIPYTSIIEQTAKTFREALGAAAVLEHHSNVPVPHEGDSEDWVHYEKARLDAENWDAPVVVTTNVQFFESLFANRPSRCRKLHNIAGSVVVLDEAQMIPADYLLPCLAVMEELAANYNVTFVLCTATQPALERSDWLDQGLEGVREIVPDPATLHDSLRRTRIEPIGPCGDEALAETLAERERVLCIVNTRAHAAELFQRLHTARPEDTFHLSARMTPAHRSQALDTIRAALNSEGRACRVVTTQLIEAGVDVDFPEVFRAMAGLDSITQAAGRCNREGRHALGVVRVFEPERSLTFSDWKRRAAIAAEVMAKYPDAAAPDATRAFFRELFNLLQGGGLDRKQVLHRLTEGCRHLTFPFKSVAEEFTFIETEMEPVIVPRGAQAEDCVNKLREGNFGSDVFRALAQHTVQIHPNEAAALARARDIEPLGAESGARLWWLSNKGLYDEALGLRVDRAGDRDAEGLMV